MNDSILNKLRSHGLRITKARKLIVSLFRENNAPLSIIEVCAFLIQNSVSIDKATVYRQVESLVEIGLLEPVILQHGMQHFEWKREHHHHFVCNECTSIVDVSDKLIESSIHAFEAQFALTGHKILTHNLEFKGLCAECA